MATKSAGNKMKSVVLTVLIFAILIGLMTSSSEGFIEFKKAHTTNSPKVCGEELCDKRDDGSDSYKIRENRNTPLGQYMLGIPLDKITCKRDLEFVIKSSNWHPACVKSQSVPKLIQIGWAASPDEYENIQAATAKRETPQLQPIKEYQEEFPAQSGVGIGITPNSVDGKRYLIFDGYGWHRLHNVEITISNEEGEEVEFLITKTSDQGDLYMPWQIPDTIVAGLYNITATDGIHDYEINIPIVPLL